MATPSTPSDATHSIIDLLMDELRQSLEPKLLHALADYHLYKETHNAVLQIPFVKHLLENQCKCHAKQSTHDPIQLEIIDVATEHALPNLDSIAEYINTTISHDNDSDDASETRECEEEPEESEDEEESEVKEDSDDNDEKEEEEEEEQELEKEEVNEESDDEVEEEEEEEEVQESEDEAEESKEEAEEEEEAEESKDESEKEDAEEEAEESKEEAEESKEEAEEEELELFEVEIKGKTYVTNDETDGDIYAYVNDEVGEIVGTFKNGVAKFAKKAKSKST